MRKLLPLVLLIAAAACGDSTAPDTSFAGTYALQSYDGVSLPVSINLAEDASVTVLSGSLTLTANGTFTVRTTAEWMFGGEVETSTDGVGGTFTRTGNTFRLTDEDGDTYTATYDGSSRVTVDIGGTLLVYTR